MRSTAIAPRDIRINLNVPGFIAENKTAKLIYVSDSSSGISRIKSGKGFTYKFGLKKITDEETLARIRKLAIPPAWTDVWICKLPNGHLQATGKDIRGRKQYRYHTLWGQYRNQEKFSRMIEFGENLPDIRLAIEKDISRRTLDRNKVIALVISLMERTFIRIGNSEYEKLYGSYGLTTLKDHHVKIDSSEVKFSFKGKKGISHNLTLRNKKLARILKQCRDIPGKELFQYYDENGIVHSIDSGDVNEYIRTISGNDFTAKDFRTWAGTLQALRELLNMDEECSHTERKKKIVEALDHVSHQLGNTRTVCRKYYVHPGLLELFENQCLKAYVTELDEIEKDDDRAGLTCEEKMLLKVLKVMHE